MTRTKVVLEAPAKNQAEEEEEEETEEKEEETTESQRRRRRRRLIRWSVHEQTLRERERERERESAPRQNYYTPTLFTTT